jgi:hypothetical protein
MKYENSEVIKEFPALYRRCFVRSLPGINFSCYPTVSITADIRIKEALTSDERPFN